jgi:hypothetical protein
MEKIPQSLSLNPDERNGYLDALLAVITADNILDTDEVVKIYELFAILGIRSGRRRQILESIICQPEAYSSLAISSSILANETLSLSLAKDLMLLKEYSKDSASRLLAAKYLESINLSNDQLDVINRFIMIEREILASLSAGKEWIADEKSWKELVGKAMAVGVPLAALNIAGVDALNTVQISSGLATLGSMSGLASLGLNSMSAGIGALILGGVAIKKITKRFMSSEDSEKRSQLEAFKAARNTAKQAITSDLLTIARVRKREYIRPRRRHRRAVLRASMIESITRLSS